MAGNPWLFKKGIALFRILLTYVEMAQFSVIF